MQQLWLVYVTVNSIAIQAYRINTQTKDRRRSFLIVYLYVVNYISLMNNPRKPRSVREPLQIYMASDERRLLDHLSDETGLSRAEILRQGLRQFALQRAGANGPMETLMRTLREKPLAADIAASHDEHLARAYTDHHDT